MKMCPTCQKTYLYEQNVRFCEDCGSMLVDSNENTIPNSESINKESNKKPTDKKKIIIIALILIFVVAIGAVLIFLFGNSKTEPENFETVITTETENYSEYVNSELLVVEKTSVTEQITSEKSFSDAEWYYVLSSMTDSSGEYKFIWNDNICTQISPTGERSVFDLDNHEISEKDNAVYTYSADGDVLVKNYTDGTIEYFSYNSEKWLVRYACSMSSGKYKTVDYIYNQDGKIEQSILEEFSSVGGDTEKTTQTDYIYDKYGNVISQIWIESAADGSVISGARTYKYEQASQEQYELYINSEIVKKINVRLNVYTNKLIDN